MAPTTLKVGKLGKEIFVCGVSSAASYRLPHRADEIIRPQTSEQYLMEASSRMMAKKRAEVMNSRLWGFAADLPTRIFWLNQTTASWVEEVGVP